MGEADRMWVRKIKMTLICRVQVDCLKPMEIEAFCRGPDVWAGVEDTGIVPTPSDVSSLAL